MTYTTEQLEKMLADATPGPWRVRINKRDSKDECDLSICGDIFVLADLNGPQYEHQHPNAALIAAAPTITAELTAARRKLEAVTWQPIATAPKDGTEFLGFVGASYQGGVVVIHWDKNDGFIDWGADFWEPTHWMPLPAPPAATQRGC